MPASTRERIADLRRQALDLGGPALLLLLVVCAAPLALGGVHLPTRIAVTGVALLALVWQGFALRRRALPLYAGPVGWGLVVLLLWSFVQWLPLPHGVVEALSPSVAATYESAAAALGQPVPGWHPLTLDRAATAASWISLLGLLAAYLTAANLFRSTQGRRYLGVFVELAALGVLVVGLMHLATGADRIYGFYEGTTSLAGSPLPTSFVNENHAAALMLLGACAGVGTWLSADNRDMWRLAHLGIAALLVVGIVMTQSRANIVLVGGVLLVATLVVLARERGSNARRMVRAYIAVACLAAVAVLFIGLDRWLEGLSGVEQAAGGFEGAARCWSIGLDVARDHLVCGVGPGAFGVAASSLTGDWGAGFIDYAHNLPIQTLASYGLPAAIVGGGLILFGGAVALWRGWGRIPAIGAAAGVTALVIQNQVDFSLAIPGVGMSAIILVGWLTSEHRSARLAARSHRGDPPPARLSLRWSAPLAVVLVAALVFVSMSAVRQAGRHWESRLSATIAEGVPGRVPLETVLEWHPSNFRLFALGAVAAQGSDRPELARRLADHAVSLAPTEPGTLTVHARVCLQQRDVECGTEDLVTLFSLGGEARLAAHDEALRFRNVPGLTESYYGQSAEILSDAAKRLVTLDQPAARRALLEWGLKRFPEDVGIKVALGGIWARDKREHKRLDRMATKMLAAGAEAEGPDAVELKRAGYLLEGYRLDASKRYDLAFHMFLAAAAEDPERELWPLLMAARMAARTKADPQLARMLERARPHVTRESPPHVGEEFHYLESLLLEREGRLSAAVDAVNKALRVRPKRPRLLRRLAHLYEAEGDERSAELMRKRISMLEKGDADPRRWLNPEVDDGGG